jgi:hypothetical protein
LSTSRAASWWELCIIWVEGCAINFIECLHILAHLQRTEHIIQSTCAPRSLHVHSRLATGHDKRYNPKP